MILLLAILLACTAGPADTEPTGATDTEHGTHSETHSDSDTEASWGEPDATVDVLVIGSGPAGLAAAWQADQLGASVLVLERETSAGGAGPYITGYYAVATPYQEERGVEDTVEQALEDWDAATGGGDHSEPVIESFLTASSEVVQWLVEDLGGILRDVAENTATDEVPRVHAMTDLDDAPIHALAALMSEETWLGYTVGELVFDGEGRLVGAAYTDAEGATGWVEAGATIIATGGFARNLDQVRWDRSEVEALDVLLFDHGPTVDGGGLPLLDDAGADWQNRGHIGLYIHGTREFREGYEDELLFLGDLQGALIVDLNGERVADESLNHAFDFAEHLLDAPDHRLFAVWPDAAFAGLTHLVAPYNAFDASYNRRYTSADLLEGGAATRYDDAEAVETALLVNGDALQAAIDLADAVVAGDTDDPLGKDADDFRAFDGDALVVVELYPSVNKAFSGARTDASFQVLDAGGEPIEGLYAAGEVAGMLGTEAIGQGFTGSATAVYWTGWVAAESAVGALP